MYALEFIRVGTRLIGQNRTMAPPVACTIIIIIIIGRGFMTPHDILRLPPTVTQDCKPSMLLLRYKTNNYPCTIGKGVL
jgi:hypothetical protein